MTTLESSWIWFDPRRGLHRVVVFLLLFFGGGDYMYVWCELYAPRWYEGALASRYGFLVPSGMRRVLGV